ncbi:MAG: ribosome-associated translation inhibitor RaiA [Deltaproteobacteria bacterium]|nr:ribosome-associated translation inhibitor RaiA [Deltaproteobacteria bacterium]
MNISVTFRNTDAEDWLKDYVSKRLSKLERYIDKPVEAQVTLSVEKFRNVAEIKILAKGMNVNGREEAKEMVLAVDTVTDKIERQIKKIREKTRNHKDNAVRARKEPFPGGGQDVAFEDVDEPSRNVEVKKMTLQPMSLDDAVLMLEESKNRFFIYRDSASEAVSVIYRRDDGGFTLIETN